MQIIDVAGLKNTGKTTVVENLVSEFANRGYKVGTLKKIHFSNFTIDTPGKDTYRHRQAGAEFVISLAPSEVALIKNPSSKDKRDLDEISSLIPDDTDFLICEELNEAREDIIYILTLISLDQLDETMQVRAVGKNILAICGPVSSKITEHDRYPVIDTTTNSGKKKIVDMILERSE